jgi:hypothetical protein
MTNYANQTIILFPANKKSKKSPDYRGSINDANREKIVDLIYYVRKPKTSGYYFSGYLFVPDNTIVAGVGTAPIISSGYIAVKSTITVEAENPEENRLPTIIGNMQIGEYTYKIALWKKLDKNGKHYYSGKISL